MTDDLQRLRQEYAERGLRFQNKRNYTLFDDAQLFIFQQRQRATLRLLRNRNFYPLNDKKVLEIGCGTGEILAEFLAYGTRASHCVGLDLLSERLGLAKQKNPAFMVLQADGQSVPVASNSVDLVLQYMAFSCILDEKIKTNIAQEMMRVLRKPSGIILWYDFWINPNNKQTKGVPLGTIQKLFAGCKIEAHKITLAPPVTRRLAPISWQVCLILEKLSIFNSHYLVGISMDR